MYKKFWTNLILLTGGKCLVKLVGIIRYWTYLGGVLALWRTGVILKFQLLYHWWFMLEEFIIWTRLFLHYSSQVFLLKKCLWTMKWAICKLVIIYMQSKSPLKYSSYLKCLSCLTARHEVTHIWKQCFSDSHGTGQTVRESERRTDNHQKSDLWDTCFTHIDFVMASSTSAVFLVITSAYLSHV